MTLESAHPDAEAAPSATRRGLSPLLSILLIAAAVCALCYNGDTDGPIDLYHEGDRLAAYDALAAGALPYRDVYVSHGLGEDVIKPYMACEWLGASVESLRRVGRNSYIYSGYLTVLGPLAVLLAGMAWLRDVRAVALLALILVCGLYEISERPAMAMAAVAATGMWHHHRRWGWMLVAGICTGLATLYSMETGVFVGLAIAGWLVAGHLFLPKDEGERARETARALGTYALGFLVVFGPFLVWCGARGILEDFIENTRIQFGLRGEVWPNVYPSLAWTAGETWIANLLVNGAVAGMFYVLPLAYFAGVVIALGKRESGDAATRRVLLFASLLGICFWLSPMAQSDVWHVAYVTGVFSFFAAALFWYTRKVERPGVSRRVAGGMVVFVCVTLVLVADGGGLVRRLTGRASRFVPAHLQSAEGTLVQASLPRIGNVKIPYEQNAELGAIVGLIQRHSAADDYLLDLSDQPLLYFLAERRCPTRFHLMSQCNSPPLREMMLAELRKKPKLPRLIVYPGTNAPVQDSIGEIIRENYRPLAMVGGLQVFTRNEE
ncbi:hypothetical protein B7486_16285 [cyanobacterium TDX16]|nr:hypothetical protein B7486_16285 [cyanobacterium TDX16]